MELDLQMNFSGFIDMVAERKYLNLFHQMAFEIKDSLSLET
jgi:hypothetical protein